MNPGHDVAEPCIDFEDVLAHELDLVDRQRLPGRNTVPADGTPIYAQARAMHLAGLAFSGGGIRSAAYNLGFIQGLANGRSLHLFDYLSTVSGGGYIGSWLSALLRRSGDAPPGEAEVRDRQQVLATPPAPGTSDGASGFPAPESRPVRFLRRYANYLTPRLGMSGDTLALLSIALRNVVVMQFLLVSLLVTCFSLMLLAAGLADGVPKQTPSLLLGALTPLYGAAGVDPALPGRWLMAPALCLMLVALLLSLWSQTSRRDSRGGQLPNTWVISALLAAMAAGILLAIGLRIGVEAGAPMTGGPWVLLPASAYCLAWIGTLRHAPGRALRALVGLLAGAITFALSLHLGIDALSTALSRAPDGFAFALAPAASMLLCSLVITIHLGLAGAAISEQQREWWGRAGGQGIALSLVWSLAFAFLLFVPPLIQYGAAWSVAGGGLWTALSGLGARLAEGARTGGKDSDPRLDLLARLVPWLFVGGLIGLVAWAFTALLPGVRLRGATLAETLAVYQTSLAGVDMGMRWLIALVAGGLFLLLVAFVDLNLFSAHSFYCNRLARTFLGASHDPRTPNAFTGFDPLDDMPLADLAGQRPIHLINTNLNMTGGQELAWQTRRGASFVFTPGHSGYSARTSLGDPIGGYRDSAQFGGGLSLATVVAVSGAAASPNMGFHTSVSVSALLTAFNLRLARWCPNPTLGQWRRREPCWWSAGPLFAELMGEARSDNAWINLSDGGHFENLGLYELARRRAGLIVVTDVAEDGDYRFDDLALAARRLSVDFGVHLDIDASALDAIRPPACKEGPRLSAKSWAVGRIRYPDCAPGILVYVKSSLSVCAPIDIRQYRDAHPTFPHESTADQWFDEDQFEAYRHLGQCTAEGLLASLDLDTGQVPARECIEAICSKLETLLSTPAPAA